MTKTQLLKFIEIRNKSGFNNNLQFTIDAGEAGFEVEDLGEVEVEYTDEGDKIYKWFTKHGTLIEKYGKLELIENT